MRRLIRLLTVSFVLGGFTMAEAATNRTSRTQTTGRTATIASKTAPAAASSVTRSETATVESSAESTDEATDDTTTATSRIHAGRTRNGSVAIVGQGSEGDGTMRTLSSSLSAQVDSGNAPLSMTPGLMASTIDRSPELNGDGQTLETQLARAQRSRSSVELPADGTDYGAPDLGATPLNGPGSPGHEDVVRVDEANRLADFPDSGVAGIGGGGGGVGGTGVGGGTGVSNGDSGALAGDLNGTIDALNDGEVNIPTSTGGTLSDRRSSNLTTEFARSTVNSRSLEDSETGLSGLSTGSTGAVDRVRGAVERNTAGTIQNNSTTATGQTMGIGHLTTPSAGGNSQSMSVFGNNGATTGGSTTSGISANTGTAGGSQ